MASRRGRPKQYDPQTALQQAGGVFWAQGYSGTSLDDLSAAMGMNRPSIYRAFGDKQAIYRQALAQFALRMEAGFQRTLSAQADLQVGLREFYDAALEVYTGGNSALGCMVVCTAPAAAATDPDVQADLLAVIEQLDERMLERVGLAVEQGQLPKATDGLALSKLLQAVLHSLAIRVRAGESKASLQQFAHGAVTMLIDSKNN